MSQLDCFRQEVSSILLVEDDKIDIKIIKQVLKKSGVKNPVFYAQDGVMALEQLRGENGFSKFKSLI